MNQDGLNQFSEEFFDEDEFEEISPNSNLERKPSSNEKYTRVGNFIVRGNKLFKDIKNKEGKFVEVEVGYATLVDSIVKSMETGDVSLDLRYFSFGKWEKATIERGKLVKSDLKTFLNLGMDVGGKKADIVFDFIDKHEKMAPKTYTHSKLGWHIHEGELIFRLSQALQQGEAPFSEYKGPLQIAPKGSYKDWIVAINQHIIGHTPMELILAASFAAPIVGLLNVTEVAESDSLLLNIVGNSTTGKTTAAVVAASVFGSPSITHNGLIQSFNGTSNALQSIISGNLGVVLIFDETSMNMLGNKAFTSLIYKLAQNKEKARLNKESELKDTERWATVMIFTGEASILENANANEGLYVRLFEFKNVHWTKSAEHSEVLKDIMMNHYGHAGIKFVQYLLTKDPEEIKGIWQGYKKELEEQLPDTKFASRVGGKFALILTGARLANESLGINLSIENITQMLIEQEEASMDVRELAPKFYNALLQYILQNRRSFKYKDLEVNSNQEIYGKIEVVNGKTFCYIFPIILKKIATELGFPDLQVLLDELKRKGYLKHDTNKTLIKKQVFKKDELELREKVLNKKEYSPKGDYTHCIVYEGNILHDFDKVEEKESEKIKGFDPNSIPGNRKITSKPKNLADLFDDN